MGISSYFMSVERCASEGNVILAGYLRKIRGGTSITTLVVCLVDRL